jgi:phospholipid/cholesterol/gamma-HCH transport system substrate-binding protein
VNSVDLSGDHVEVEFEVKNEQMPRITTESIAKLGSISLLGEASVDITPSLRGTPVPEGGYVKTGPPAAQLADITAQAGQGLSELTALVHETREGKGTVGKLLTDEALYSELHRFVTTAGDLATGIRQGRGSVGKLLNDRATADSLEQSLRNIETLTRQLNSGEGSVGRLLKDDQFAQSLSRATDNLDALTAKLNQGQGTAGKLVSDPALYNQLNSVTQRLDQLLTRLDAGDGTAGQLLKDKQLYENMNKVAMDLSGLLTQIKNDPKKYLNVKVSLF